MSVCIYLGDMLLESDSDGWQVSETKKRTSGKTPGASYAVNTRYYSSLEQALCALQDKALRDSNAGSFSDIREALVDFRASLVGLFKLEVKR